MRNPWKALPRRQPGPRGAFTLLECLIVLAIMTVLAGLLVAAVQRVRAAALRAHCADQLRQIGLAIHHYEGVHLAIPPGIRPWNDPPPRVWHPDAYPMLHWHGRLLPFMEENALWARTVEAFAQDPLYIRNPPHVGSSTHLPLYFCPADTRRVPGHETPANTSYVGISGNNEFRWDGLIFINSNTRFADVRDGLSQTIMVGERPPSQDGLFGRWYGGWGFWMAANAFMGVREFYALPPEYVNCPRGPYHFQRGSLQNPCSTFHFWSLHPGGAHFLFGDGSVRFLAYSADPILPALASRAGGETVSLPD